MFELFTFIGLMLLCSLPFALFDPKDDPDTDPVDDTTLQGTDGADILTGTDITDLIDAGAGDDDITAGDATEIIAGLGNDSIEAGGGATISGGDGDDQITAGGESVIDAGAGDDLVNGSGGSTVSGGDGDDTLLGSGFLSAIDGGAGDDVIDAGPGVLLTTGTGADTVTLNASYPVTGDIYNSGPVTVTDYVAGQDTFEISGTYDEPSQGVYDVGALGFVETAEGVRVTIGGQGVILLQGATLADVDQSDFVPDRPPFNALEGTDGSDTLIGGPDTDLINAGAGDDDITAEIFTEIDAGAGNDTIDAGGAVTISAGDGDDQITAGGESVIDAGAGDDLVNGQGGSTVSGGDGDDTLLGSGFLSTIDGGAGDDVIDAGPGVLLTTGTGADTVSLNAAYPVTNDIYNSGPVTVTDYVAGQDTFEISGTYTQLESGDYDVGTLAFVQTAEGVRVSLAGGGVLLLQGATLADVDQSDFVPDRPPAMV